MRNTTPSLNFLFFSTLMAILIWMASPSVKGETGEHKPFNLPAYQAHYNISWHGFQAGQSIHTLNHHKDHKDHKDHYVYEIRTKPHAQILPYQYVEKTHFTWENGKILPQYYDYNVREGKKHKVGRVVFDWSTQKLFNKSVSPVWETEIPAQAHDKLTQGLALRQALKAGQKSGTYTVVEEDKIKQHTFTVLGSEQIATALGIIDTLKVQHISRKGHRTTLWLAKKWDLVPVKMVQFRQGKLVISATILSFQQLS